LVPVAAPLDPRVELVVPLALWAKAADTIPQANPAAITPRLICFFVSAHFSAHQDEHRRPAGLDGIEGAVFERQLVFWCARSPKLKGSRSSMLASVARWGSSVSTWHSQA
jgi:hypothetical protein